jgi:hypothetical protein
VLTAPMVPGPGDGADPPGSTGGRSDLRRTNSP